MKNKLRKSLESMIDGAYSYLKDKAMKMSEEFRSVAEATDAELPPMADGKGNQSEWAKERLAGKDIQTPANWITALSDCEFDVDDYKGLGENDGLLCALARIAHEVLNDEALFSRATDALYSG